MTCSLGLQPIRSQNTKTRPKTNTQFANLEGSTHEKIFFSPAGRLISICQMKNLSPAPGQNDNDIAARLANGFLSLSLFVCISQCMCGCVSVSATVWLLLNNDTKMPGIMRAGGCIESNVNCFCWQIRAKSKNLPSGRQMWFERFFLECEGFKYEARWSSQLGNQPNTHTKAVGRVFFPNARLANFHKSY